MSSISILIELAKKMEDCAVLPPNGIPEVAEGDSIPEDVREFYTLCGGMTVNNSSSFLVTIVPPKDFVLANPVIIIGVTSEQLEQSRDHPSWHWYIIAKGEGAQYISIDLCKSHNGVCYDSFWEKHPGNSNRISSSFTRFLENLLGYSNEGYFWDEPDFMYS